MTIGFLPGDDREDANGWVTLAVPTGLGEMRNGLVVRCADAVVAVGGSWGTLSEVALARKMGKPVVALGGPALDDLIVAATPGEAVAEALRRVGTKA